MSVDTQAAEFRDDLDVLLKQPGVTDEEYARVLKENEDLFEAATNLVRGSEELRQTLDQVTTKFSQLEGKINKQIELTDTMRKQKEESEEQKSFLDIKIEVMKGQYNRNSDDMKPGLESLMARFKGIGRAYCGILYHDKPGGKNWGYAARVAKSSYFHEWKDDVCHVGFKSVRRQKKSSEFDAVAKQVAETHTSGPSEADATSIAGSIFNGMTDAGFPPQLVIVKRGGGGFGRWAYHSRCRNRYGGEPNGIRVGIHV